MNDIKPASGYIIVYSDDKGRHMLALPDGTHIPKLIMTRVLQDTDQCRSGMCTVFASFIARVATPDEAKAIQAGQRINDPYPGGAKD